TARGGIGAVSGALASAARRLGAEIRIGAEVRHIVVKDGVAIGVVLATGEQLTAQWIVSNADPRRTLGGLVDPASLAPEFVSAIRNIRMRGSLAKVNYAVSSLPRFVGVSSLDQEDRNAALSGWVRIGADIDAIERAFDAAKYGSFADEPWIELAIPSILDRGLAPADQHVVSAYVQFAPSCLRDTTWDAEREHLADVATKTIERYAPGFDRSIVARQIITPLDLERTYGLTGGHIFHGELGLDHLWSARPILGWAGYVTPIENLFLCSTGTHPGTGLDGRAGALAARQVIKTARRGKRGTAISR